MGRDGPPGAPGAAGPGWARLGLLRALFSGPVAPGPRVLPRVLSTHPPTSPGAQPCAGPRDAGWTVGADSAAQPGPPSSAQPRPRAPPTPPPPSDSALHVPLTRVGGGGGARLPAASGQNTNLTTGGPAAPTPIKAIPPPVGLASLLSWGQVCVGVQGAPQASAQSLAPAPWPGVWSRALAKTRPWGHVSGRRNPD